MKSRFSIPLRSPGESDLAYERHRADPKKEGVFYKEARVGDILFSALTVSEAGEAAVGKPKGRYLSLHFSPSSFLTDEQKESIQLAFCAALRYFFEVPPKRLLVAGLGNRRLTADSLGPLTADKIEVSATIPPSLSEELGFSLPTRVGVSVPDVFAKTGIESVRSIEAAAALFEADALLVFDALAATEPRRLLSAIEICDSGTVPGGGVKNSRLALSEAMLGIPVVSVGVPCVVRTKGDFFLVPRSLEEGVHALSEILAGASNLAFSPFPPAYPFALKNLFSEEEP